MGWRIDYEGCSLREEDVTAADVSIIGMVLENTAWEIVNPMDSPAALIAWVAVTISKTTQKPLDETLLFVQQQKMEAVLNAFSPLGIDPKHAADGDVPAETPAPRVTLGEAATPEMRAAWLNNMAGV